MGDGCGSPPFANNRCVCTIILFESISRDTHGQILDEDEAAKLRSRIDRQKKELAKHQQKLAQYRDGDRKTCYINPFMTSSDHGTVNADENNNLGVESQDEVDLGHGARHGGGFTSAVSIHTQPDNELIYNLDNIERFCTARPVGTPE